MTASPLAGLALAAAGTVALSWPDPTLLVVGVALGAALVVLGALRLGDDAVVGVVSLVAGVLLVVRPEHSVAAVALVLGIWWTVTGAAALLRPPRGVLGAVAGIGAVAVGATILALPDLRLGTLVLLAGIGFVVLGVLQLVAGLPARRRAGVAA